MSTKTIVSTVTLAAMVAASFSTIAQADAGGRGGDRMGQIFSFQDMDANSDGKVTKDEITAFHAAKVAAMDTDKDGNLSEAELIAAQTARKAEREAEREARREAKMAKRLMEKRDANKDGVLSLAEMAPLPDRADKMFARIDTDGDGAISKAEADVMAEKMAKRGDDRDKEHRGGNRKHDKRDDG